MLSNIQVEDLAKRMGIRLEGVYFKSQLKEMKLKPNVAYIINLEDGKTHFMHSQLYESLVSARNYDIIYLN